MSKNVNVSTKNTEYGYSLSFEGNIPSKKNSKQIVTKPFPRLISSKAYLAWHKTCSQTLKMARIEPIRLIEVNLYDKLNKDGTEPKRKFDLTNKAESIMDLLVDCKIIEDDNYKVIPQMILSFAGFRDEQGAEVFIYIDKE